MKNLFLFLLYICISQHLFSQQALSVRISQADDDLEEYLPGTNQTKTPGAIDVGSSDLELGMETKDNIDPQLIGLRFNSITIPKGALILKAYIQFTVDNTSKNTDPCNLNIFIEESSNAAAFNSSESFNLSKRKKINEFIPWNIKNGSWETVGLMDKDQASPNISSLVQKVIDLEGWNSGNSLAIYITGSGLREAESFDGAPTMAPLLIIEYVSSLSFNQRVESADDDLEEYLPGPNQTKIVGAVDIGSSDLELGMETKDNIDPQYIGIRFNKIEIPTRSKIKSAYLQFTVDNTSKNTDPCNLLIFVENSVNSLPYNVNESFVLTKRKVLSDSISWNIVPATWNTVGEKSLNQRSPDLSKLLQSVIDQEQWNKGNSVSFFIKGTGLREAESFDGSPADAPQLVIEYIPVVSSEFTILTAEDDLEEYLPGSNQTKLVGSMDAGSSDLELGTETKDNIDPQLVGMRFDKIKLPKGALISNAYIQFTVDNTSKNTDPCDLTIWVEDAGQSVQFNSSEPFNLSKRKLLKDSVNWNITKSTWNTIGEKSNNQRTPNLNLLINQILSKSDWNEGNAISLFVKGTGLREAESYDGSQADAPKLVLEYFQDKKPPIQIGSFPVLKKSEWSFFDSSYIPSSDWFKETYSDERWNYGFGPLGYGDSFIATKISFGANENNKNTTAYFRKKIQIDDISKLNDFIEFGLRADDGAIIYVNGVEVIRYNVPTGNIKFESKAIDRILGVEELPYFVYDVPKTFFKNGMNLIAVEIHQWEGISTDLCFDLEIKNQTSVSNPTDLGCSLGNEKHISCFTSLIPKDQDELIKIPSSHKFQYLAGAREPYIGQSGAFGTNFDFTGYVPIDKSSTRGYVSINHETYPGGVSIIEVSYNPVSKVWESLSSGPVDFSPVVLTAANCSGTVTPWNTIITCEETTGSDTLDINKDGYSDLGWAVEIDPKTRKIKDYGNGPEKLWAVGRMDHENVVILSDKRTLYQGEDDSNGSVYKFIADKEENLSKGKLYVLKLNSIFVNGEPTGTEGIWLEVPNATIKERNDVKKWALANGATRFAGVEDVEVNPVNGQIYFAVKGVGRIYRFQDNGSTVSKFETFVGGRSYRINSGGKVVSEPWGLGNDNLTFDNLENLWVLQDGGSNFIWVVRPDHTQEKPKVEIFMHNPIGSEPTGMTFTPDFKTMFLSVQEPSSANNLTIKDVNNKDVKFNKSTCIVISRNDNLGVGTKSIVDDQKVSLSIMPNPFTQHSNIKLTIEEKLDFSFTISNIEGKIVYNSNNVKLDSGTHNLSFSLENDGLYILTARINGKPFSMKLINQR